MTGAGPELAGPAIVAIGLSPSNRASHPAAANAAGDRLIQDSLPVRTRPPNLRQSEEPDSVDNGRRSGVAGDIDRAIAGPPAEGVVEDDDVGSRRSEDGL